jgi:hypothetical protein
VAVDTTKRYPKNVKAKLSHLSLTSKLSETSEISHRSESDVFSTQRWCTLWCILLKNNQANSVQVQLVRGGNRISVSQASR